MTDLSDYIVKENGEIFYFPRPLTEKEIHYRVWAIGNYGFIHGVGSYIKKETFQDCDYIQIDECTFQETENYYKDLDNLFK